MRASLSVINTNWENPVNGITDCTKSMYKLLILVYIDYSRIKGIELNDFLVEEAKVTLKLSWSAKGKYRRLSILFPYLGFDRFLALDSSIPEMLFKHLSINSLSSSITEAYKIIVKSLLHIDSPLQTWSECFLNVVCDAICSRNSVIHNHTVAHILPFTVQLIPEALHLIYERIGDKSEARVLLVKVAHNKRIELNGLKDNCLRELLLDDNDQVRLESFSFLLNSQFVSSDIHEKIFQFLKMNLNIDSPVFRQKLVAIIEKFIASNLMRNKNKKRVKEKSEFEMFTAQYVQFLSDNLIPGTSFQRKTTSLLLLESLFNSTKCIHFSEEVSQLLWRRLLLCIIDRYDPIRKMCSQLLILSSETCYEISTVMQIAFNLIHSPKHQESHSGALLLRYIVHRFKPFHFQGNEFNCQFDVLMFIFNLAKDHFKYTQKNDLLNASFNFPLHGCILALSNMLENDVIMKSETKLLSQFMVDCKTLLKDIFNAMLDWLSSSISSKSSPTFQEMSVTLEKIIDEEVGERESTLLSTEFQCLLSYYWLNVKECCYLTSKLVQLQDQYNVKLMSDADILELGRYLVDVLMRCRHIGVIETCSIVLTDYSKCAMNLHVKFGSDVSPTKLLLTEVLESLNTRSLLSNVTRRSAGVALIIQSILSGEVLFVNDNAGNVKKEDVGLFDIAMNSLLTMIESNYSYVAESNTDHPLSLSMHIIRTIIHTNLLSNFSSVYLEKLIKLCIIGLTSKEWVIRNASLQLFGGCCLRILGQTKAAEDYSITQFPCTLTCAELFLKFPSLVSIIEECLNTGIKDQRQQKLSNSLIPVLNLLSSLSVCGLDATVSTTITSFLETLLSNPIWKVRSLAAKSLLSVANIEYLQSLLAKKLQNESLSSNTLHGIIQTVHNLLTAKSVLNIEGDLCETLVFEIRRKLNDNHVLQSQFRVLFENADNGCELVENVCNIQHEFPPFSTSDIKSWLVKIYDNCDPNKSEDYRMFTSQVLLENIDAIKEALNVCSDNYFLFYDILFRLLEDEDSDIRRSCTRVVQRFLNASFNPSFNVCTQQIIEKSLSQRTSTEVIKYLWNYLEAIDSFTELQASFEAQQNIVMFEEEDKNVFAERLIRCQFFHTILDNFLETNELDACITEKSLMRISEELIHLQCNPFTIESIMKYSTNQLPKLYQSLYSFIVRFQIARKYSISFNSTTKMLSNSYEQLRINFFLIGLQL
ncbi:thyroid adenoma-associated protein-like protein [Leptotrombidium deliense]|uniref:Thyroid adenoma-associated protein-like protein n=1 Tax=Leptotrombidium deliense TaxID=299467 RepID=A0A443SJW8_9ACAR|nr:thyroid adenoma-associated protein-like protein [Leptotrombidium deliense]